MKLIIKEYSFKEDEDYNVMYDEYDNPIFDELLQETIIEDELTLFVYDNCHKIYLVEDKDDIESVKSMWGEDTIFYNIDELPRIWEETCPLRFISNWKLDKQIIHQCCGAEFIFED